MKIKDIFKNKDTVISFEIFPPNNKFPIEKIYKTIDELAELKPDYISVTYGAGGTSQSRTVEITKRIKNINKIETMAHLTCIGATKESINSTLTQLKNNGIKNILALRGDIPRDKVYDSQFSYASDLVKHIKKENTFSVAGAFYPEVHFENNDLLDLFHLKTKVESGTDFLVSQLFFDNEDFYAFKEKTQKLNLNIPLVAGILPVTNYKQIQKVRELCNARIPRKFQAILDKFKDNPKALEEAGITYATEQIIDLIASGVEGIHIYTMNKVDVTRRILENIKYIRKGIGEAE
ncbi:methylenetetrahydrofolate reductase [NAD(P)H] [Psychrilyobacter atlanticus]|uniref:methylenetetrahydrofolate reductase [NAD(P)H] n=1 Tax=Psychrilyobacter atlanticus TaxID=271091 RepID=UPI0003F77F1E|nr:methylenetetrahydrofolate reductase [NAD(P)H] [Psychrilyobacter atlanticus]